MWILKKLFLLNNLCIFYILSYFIPKKKNLYIFWWLFWKSFSWNSRYLFEYLKRKNEFEVYYFTRDKDLLNKEEKILKINWFLNFWLLLRSEYIFFEWWLIDVTYFPLLLWNFNYINLWHWEPIKKVAQDIYIQWNFLSHYLHMNNLKKTKLVISSNEIHKYILKNAFLCENTKVTWLPRNDIFFNNLNKDKNLEDIIWNKKVILYAPTFRENWLKIRKFSNNFLITINDFCKKNNILFILKYHHLEKLEDINLEKFSNFILLPQYFKNTQEILKKTDLLITDYSSIFFDFLLKQNDILFYSYDLNEYISKNRELYFNYKELIPKKLFIDNEELLIEKIKNSFNYNFRNNKREISFLLNKYHDNINGNFCENVINEIKKI